MAALIEDKKGAAAIEYALICALIVLTIVAGIAELGASAEGEWSDVDHQLNNSITFSTN